MQKNMKSRTGFPAFCVMLIFCLIFGGCGSAAKPAKHTIGYPDQYDTTSAGASSFNGACDDRQSKYFVINDYYNMKSQGTLHILHNFETYQQTTEYTCGAASAHMVVNWFDKELSKRYDELTIAQMSGTDTQRGVGPTGLDAFFRGIGWQTEVSASPEGYFESPDAFEKFVIEKIDAGIPIMVDWVDWSGHWQVIIGIDTCKEDNDADDVLILADPYDTSDQWQDGYYTFGAQRFYYMWTEGNCTGKDPKDIFVHPFVVAEP